MLLRRVCEASRKQELIKQSKERCFVVEKVLVSRNEPGELETIDAIDLEVLIIADFLL